MRDPDPVWIGVEKWHFSVHATGNGVALGLAVDAAGVRKVWDLVFEV